MDSALTQWIVGQVGLAGVAAFSIQVLSMTFQAWMKREVEYAASNREDKKLMFELIERNTAANTKLITMIEGSYGRTTG